MSGSISMDTKWIWLRLDNSFESSANRFQTKEEYSIDFILFCLLYFPLLRIIQFCFSFSHVEFRSIDDKVGAQVPYNICCTPKHSSHFCIHYKQILDFNDKCCDIFIKIQYILWCSKSVEILSFVPDSSIWEMQFARVLGGHRCCWYQKVFLDDEQYGIDLFSRAVEWKGLLLVPCRPADKSKRLMYHGTQPNPNFVYRRPFYGLHCHVNIRLYCLAQGLKVDRILSRCQLLHVHRRISLESAFPSICSDPKLIPFVGALFARHLGFLVVAITNR